MPYLATAAIAAWLVVVVLWGGRGQARRWLAMLLTTLGLTVLAIAGVLSAADASTATRMARWSQVPAMWIAPCALEFASALTGRPAPRWWRLARVTAAALGLFSIFTPWVVASSRVYVYGFAGNAGPLHPLAAAQMLLAGAAPLSLWKHGGLEKRALIRKQLRVIALSAMVGMLALTDALPVIGWSPPPIGWVPLVGSAAGLVSAIIRYRLLELRLALRRSSVWIAMTGVGALPFVLLGLLLRPRFATTSLKGAFLLVALVVAMRAYLVTVQPSIDRLVGRRRRDRDVEMAIFADEATALQTTEELGEVADRFLSNFDRRLSALIIIGAEGRPKLAFAGRGPVPVPTRGSPVFDELAEAPELISVERARELGCEQIEHSCARWSAEYLAPLIEGESVLGVFAISPKAGGGLADSLELETLERVRVMLTAAVAGVRLYDRLRALSEELEQKAATRRSLLAGTVEDLRGAEARLVHAEKLSSLGNIVAGVAADLGEEVGTIHAQVAPLRVHAEAMTEAARAAFTRLAELRDTRLEEITRDVGPLLDAVAEGARRAYAIARDLGRFAPSRSADSPPLIRQPAHLAALADSTLTLVTDKLANIQILRRYDESVPVVMIEPGPIGQVILNLVLNAIQAMSGSGTLGVATRLTDGFAELAVSDTGVGIAPDILPHIFEPFFSTKGGASGTGLGLSVSYGIVERHGGRIVVENGNQQGATFRVLLPVKADG